MHFNHILVMYESIFFKKKWPSFYLVINFAEQ
jgi:hypothetical protein